MNFESNNTSQDKITPNLSSGFKELVSSENTADSEVFKDLEESLSSEGFSLASEASVSSILNSNSLVCRSQSFDGAMDLILDKQPIDLINRHSHANMCVMASGEGFRVAMTEGFSSKDVGGVVKVVLTFRESHLDSSKKIPHDDDLWVTKPDTAKVSLVGKGEITIEDLEMISFRFPVRFYPEELLTDSEKERLDNEEISFIVRHYIPNNEKTIH